MAFLTEHRELYINGRWVPSKSGNTFDVTDPATEDVLCVVADGGSDDARAAVDAASSAFPGWAALSGEDRAKILMKARNLLEANLDDVARILTQEQGKPLSEAQGELQGCISFLEWYAEEGKRIYGEVVSGLAPSKRQLVIKQPVGVSVLITPWNFPAMMIVRKAASALAAGCPIIAKPAEQTPMTAIALFEIFAEAGFPPGVVNLITTNQPQEVGDVFLTDTRVRHITFTGSTVVGKYLASEAAKQVKRVSLELGGHAPWIIFEDADVELALDHIVVTKFKNVGQTCVCPNRIFVHSSLIDSFSQRLAEKASQLRIGSGLEQDTQVGPLIDLQAIEKVQSHVSDAVAKGARLLTGGERLKQRGYFYQPTVLAGVTNEMLISSEETFGPIAPVIPFETEAEVIERANDTPYGLTAYFYTRDVNRSFRVAEALEYGVVGVNDNRPGSTQTPFGGFKESGLGREQGREGLEEFLEVKTISFGGF